MNIPASMKAVEAELSGKGLCFTTVELTPTVLKLRFTNSLGVRIVKSSDRPNVFDIELQYFLNRTNFSEAGNISKQWQTVEQLFTTALTISNRTIFVKRRQHLISNLKSR